MNLLPWLDDLLEIAPLLDRVIKDGVSLTVFVGIAVFLLKRFYKKYRKNNPSQQDRIEMKLDIIAERQGIQWDATSLKSYSQVSATKQSSVSTLRTWVGTIVRSAIRKAIRCFTKFLINQRRKFLMTNKLKSRKFWMAVVTGVLIVLNDGLDLGIDSDTVLAFAGIVATFIIGEAAVDASRTKSNNDDFSH